MSEPKETLTAPKEALFDYLDSMLQDVSERLDEKNKVASVAQAAPAVVRVAKKAKPLVKAATLPSTPEPKTTSNTVPVVNAQSQEVGEVTRVKEAPAPSKVPKSEIIEVKDAVAEVVQGPLPPNRHEGIPDWAGQNFDCLLFKVSGLSLAVPMVLLGNIHPMNIEKLTPLFHHPDWFIGLLPLSHNRNIKVLDTAQLVMPERCRGDEKERFAYVIGIDNNDWGFACDEIVGSVTLKSTEVKWRTKRSNRPWLAGTVISQMCALIDLHATAELLESAAN